MSESDTKSAVETSEDTRTVFRSPDALSAEHISLILALFGIRAAVINNNADPFRCGIALIELIVMASERERAEETIAALQTGRHSEDWRCPACAEEVPDTFDLCWNCGELHPELDDEQAIPDWVDREAVKRREEMRDPSFSLSHEETSARIDGRKEAN